MNTLTAKVLTDKDPTLRHADACYGAGGGRFTPADQSFRHAYAGFDGAVS